MFSRLTNRQLMELAVVALKNVCQYKKDAQLLIENDSYGRALSLSILGIEEFAKGMTLYACSYNYLSQEETEILLGSKKTLKNHKWKLDTALEKTIILMLASWAGKELERALKRCIELSKSFQSLRSSLSLNTISFNLSNKFLSYLSRLLKL